MTHYPPASLMGLPSELRLSIFEFALADEQINLRHRQNSRIAHAQSSKRVGTAFLAINSQLRREVKPIYLENVTFSLRHFTEQDLHGWLETIGRENIHRLRKLAFFCIGRCSMYGFQPE